MKSRLILILILLALLLTACKGQKSGSAGAIEAYFKAVVAKDPNQAANLSCAAWEETAQNDANSFGMNPAKLENLQCQEDSKDGKTANVSCSGKIVMDYNGELQELNLADRSYQAVEEGGEWRMCGYK